MRYRIRLSSMAEEHLEYWRRCGQPSVLRKLAGIFDELEDCLDSCEEAVDVVELVIMKNS